MGRDSILHGSSSCCCTSSRCSWFAPLVLLLSLLAFSTTASAYSYASWHECGSQAVYGGAYGAEVMSNLSDFKSSLLSHVWSSFDPTVPMIQGFKRFDELRPHIKCPPHKPLKRYGGKADGGKLLCDVSHLPTPCLIYSLGSNGDYTFEQDMLKTTKCEIHTFDCTYNGVSQDPTRHFYHKWCVGANKDPNFKTWEEITTELGHQHRILDVFKMDTEGHEPGVIAELRHDRPLPRQIVMEIHMHSRQVDTGGIAKPAPRTRPQLALLMMHMASLGYGIVGQEDNIWGVAGCCAEWTFLLIEQPWVAPSSRYGHHKRPHAALQLPATVDAGSAAGAAVAGGDATSQVMANAGKRRRLRTSRG